MLKKIIISLSVMLWVGGACFAQQQEEFQRDSVWGLEWSLQDSILTMSFMSSCEDYIAIEIYSFKNGNYDWYNDHDCFSYNRVTLGDSRENTIHMVSFEKDTISIELSKYTLSVRLNPEYLTIPQDISTYCGYFGIIFQSQGHKRMMYTPLDDLTKCSQFMYFNLIDELSWNVDIRNDDVLYEKKYYSMTGEPLREISMNKPMIVVTSFDNQIISSKVSVWRP